MNDNYKTEDQLTTKWDFDNWEKKARALRETVSLVDIAKQLKYKHNEGVINFFASGGYIAVWVPARKVGNTSGVGTFWWMKRKKCYRLQISATIHGFDTHYKHVYSIPGGVVINPKIKRKRYHAYAWCIEIYVK